MECGKHNISKNYIFCIDNNCSGGLDCIECVVMDRKHHHCKHVIVDQFIKDAKTELETAFTKSHIYVMHKNQKVDQFINEFDS